MLPAPQVSDRELEEIARLGSAAGLGVAEDLEEGSAATKALLSNYSQTPGRGSGATPLRTPQRTPAVGGGDAIMMEAENLAKLRDTQTPLLGGENPNLSNSDFSGITPKKKEAATPNPIATPLRTPGVGGTTPSTQGATPKDSAFGLTPRGTPLRDELQINEGIGGSGGMDTPMSQISLGEDRARLAELRQQVKAGFSSLPAPQNEYAIQLPPAPEDSTKGEDDDGEMVPDMADILENKKKVENAQLEAEWNKRSSALKKNLPRPTLALVNRVLREKPGSSSVTILETAENMVRNEMAIILEHDLLKYPSLEQKKGPSSDKNINHNATPIEEFNEDELASVSLPLSSILKMFTIIVFPGQGAPKC